MHKVIDPADTSAVSKVSSGKPWAAASNALAEVNVIDVAPARTATETNEMAVSATTNDLREQRRWPCRISMVCLLDGTICGRDGVGVAFVCRVCQKRAKSDISDLATKIAGILHPRARLGWKFFAAGIALRKIRHVIG